MSKAKASVKKTAFVPPALNDASPMAEKLQSIYGLISSGHLPPADTVTKDGQPTWSFDNLACILGCDADELIQLLRSKTARFSIEPGARH
ncbi:hypothetical protein JCM19379_06160 [Methyloparacoccus murrellii]